MAQEKTPKSSAQELYDQIKAGGVEIDTRDIGIDFFDPRTSTYDIGSFYQQSLRDQVWPTIRNLSMSAQRYRLQANEAISAMQDADAIFASAIGVAMQPLARR